MMRNFCAQIGGAGSSRGSLKQSEDEAFLSDNTGMDEQTEPTLSHTGTTAGQTAPRVLVVDDHPNTASMLARVLKKLTIPAEVLTAYSGEEALERMGNGGVDVLITDFIMPGMSGLELIERLKKEGREPGHVILITAYDIPGLVMTTRQLKVQDYLVKPVDPEKIRGIVDKVLQQMHPQQAGGEQAGGEQAAKILIADDNPDNIRLLAVRLQSEGYQFVAAADGEETLRKIAAERPDLILLDVNMPKKDGFEVLAEMRANPEMAHLPVIVITAARIGIKDVREGLTLGADDYITKPFDWRELSARIRTKLRVKKAEDALRQRSQRLSALPEISLDLSSDLYRSEGLDMTGLTRSILGRTVGALGASNGYLVVFNPDGGVSIQVHEPQAGLIWGEAAEQGRLASEGVVAQVMGSRQGQVIENTAVFEGWPQGDRGGQAAALAPLLGRREALGALVLVHPKPGYFKEEHLTLMQAIASQAAIAVENAQLYAAERKRVNELVALNELLRGVNRFNRSGELVEELPELVQKALGYSAVGFWLVEGGSGKWGVGSEKDEAGAGAGAAEAGAGAAEGLVLRKLCGGENAPRQSILEIAPQQAAATGQPAQLSGAIEERIGERAGVGSPPVQSALAVPLSWNGKVRGVLSVHSQKGGAFQESDRVVLETLAAQVVAALERIQLFESVEYEQRRLAAVLHSAADAILVLDENGRLALSNPAGERLLAEEAVRSRGVESGKGKGGGGARGRQEGLLEMLANFDAGPGREPLGPGREPRPREVTLAGGEGGKEETGARKEEGVLRQSQSGQHGGAGHGRTFSVVVTPVEGGGRVAIFHDVSHFKALDQIKNEFLATATHDLKNPIFAVMGYSDLLDKAGPLNPMQTDFVQRIRHAASQMQDLVVNLLDVARMEMGIELKLDVMDLNALLADSVKEFRPQAEAKGQQLELKLGREPLNVLGDGLRLQQVMRNLVGNAIKYTPNRGRVVVSGEERGSGEGRVAVVKVEDNGVGIPLESLPHLFEKFYRVRTAETQDIEGNGLGLAIVKSIIEQHHGEVHVESVVGKGSCFWFTLGMVEGGADKKDEG